MVDRDGLQIPIAYQFRQGDTEIRWAIGAAELPPGDRVMEANS